MPLSRATYIDLLFPTEQSWGLKALLQGPADDLEQYTTSTSN